MWTRMQERGAAHSSHFQQWLGKKSFTMGMTALMLNTMNIFVLYLIH